MDSSLESGGVIAVAFEVASGENPNNNNNSLHDIPKRVRRRLLDGCDSKPSASSSLEKIEAKLKEAHLRRQQFHEWLANKARPKPRSPPHPSPDSGDLMQRLQAKLSAAERKRLELLAKSQMRLAKSEEMRQAAKTEVQLRAEREREVLESKFESRVQQAECNRLALLEADKQRRAAAQKKKAQSLMQRTLLEDRDKERVEAIYSALCQRVAAAEEKRLGLLEAEKVRAHALVMQARVVANTVTIKREMEMKKLKDKLENRLQKAKRRRAELLRQRGRNGTATHTNFHKMHRHGDFLSRKLARVWRQFQTSQKTTYALAREYVACEINQSVVTEIPFDHLAARIQAASTLQAVKALLARIESRFLLSKTNQSSVTQIDHLLKRLSPRSRKLNGNRVSKNAVSQVPAKGLIRSQHTERKKLQRYPDRVFLCAYMILGHPEAVFNVRGELEIELTEAANKLLPEFESLVGLILEGPGNCSPHLSLSPVKKLDNSRDPTIAQFPPRNFASQLAAFDAAWCSYLSQFVRWKLNDAQALEQDLIGMACQLEVSMLQKCKITSEENEGDASHDIKAIRKQVLDDQHLLRERVLHLSGSEGVARMKKALTDARAKFMEAKENGAFSLSFSNTSPTKSSKEASDTVSEKAPKKVVRALFKNDAVSEASTSSDKSSSAPSGMHLSNDNIIMVNNILHDKDGFFANNVCGIGNDEDETIEGKKMKQIKSTMERAFWDGVEDSLKQNNPDYTWVVSLVKEVRDELLALIPESWKQDVLESIDVHLFSQLLESGSQDTVFLQSLLNYSLDIVLKLGAPEDDANSKLSHSMVMEELSQIMTGSVIETKHLFAQALVKGLRFILEQIQILKKKISSARIRALEPLVQGSAGHQYLQEAFTREYGPSSDAKEALPRTFQWLARVKNSLELVQKDFENNGTAVRSNEDPRGLHTVRYLRTGIQIGQGKTTTSMTGLINDSAVDHMRSVDWESIETYIRLGMLQLASKSGSANEETVPETMRLNVERLKNLQNSYQMLVVAATSMLLVRQIALGFGCCSEELEKIISDLSKKLNEILRSPTITIHEIGRLLSESCNTAGKKYSDQEFMTSMLRKSLSPDNPVFAKVSGGICSSIQAYLLGGKCSEARSMTETALKRIGVVVLVEHVEKIVNSLENIANVTSQVHSPWYSQLLREV